MLVTHPRSQMPAASAGLFPKIRACFGLWKPSSSMEYMDLLLGVCRDPISSGQGGIHAESFPVGPDFARCRLRTSTSRPFCRRATAPLSWSVESSFITGAQERGALHEEDFQFTCGTERLLWYMCCARLAVEVKQKLRELSDRTSLDVPWLRIGACFLYRAVQIPFRMALVSPSIYTHIYI